MSASSHSEDRFAAWPQRRVGSDRQAILQCVAAILNGQGKRGRTPELWDGKTAERIAHDLWQWLYASPAAARRS